MAYKPLFLAYLVYFNRDRDYFECHEVLEELWLAEHRDPLYKALLQVAVGLYHFRSGNVRGATMMLSNATQILRNYPEDTLGIDLGQLVRQAAAYAEQLQGYAEKPFPYYDLTIRLCDPSLIIEVEQAAASIVPNLHPRRGPQRRK